MRSQRSILKVQVGSTFSDKDFETLQGKIQTSSREDHGVRLMGVFKDTDSTPKRILDEYLDLVSGKVRSKVERSALITDHVPQDLRLRADKLLLAGIEFRLFSSAEEDSALHWLSLAPPEGSATQLMADHTDDFVGLEISGRPTPIDGERLLAGIRRFEMNNSGPIRLLLDIIPLQGLLIRGFWEDFREALRSITDLDRLAIIGGEEVRLLVQIAEKTYGNTVLRWFNVDEKEAAKAWMCSP